jgi:hypothetical protein
VSCSSLFQVFWSKSANLKPFCSLAAFGTQDRRDDLRLSQDKHPERLTGYSKPGVLMSRRNGDRSRFNRLRKQKLHRRTVSAAIAGVDEKASPKAAVATAAPKAATKAKKS